jgi:hypothetical protein
VLGPGCGFTGVLMAILVGVVGKRALGKDGVLEGIGIHALVMIDVIVVTGVVVAVIGVVVMMDCYCCYDGCYCCSDECYCCYWGCCYYCCYWGWCEYCC